MILLNGQSLAAKDRFPVESMPLNLEERNSSATITVGPDAPGIAVNNWLKDDTEPGAGIVWRVKAAQEQVETRTRTIQLEHVIQTLKDTSVFGEATPAVITGNKNAKTCTARQAITWALGKQSVWRLGDLAENPSNPYTFNGDTVFAIVEAVTASIDGAQWEYDLSALPFTLHIRKTPAGFSSEMRMSRNITSLRKQVDRTRMYTRIWPIGKNNLHIDGDYLSKNEGVWGRVDKVETDQSQDTKEKLRAWGQERLNRHCEPLVTVTVSGLEMSRDTGEPLDHITVGRRCRMPLPEYGTTITEKVTRISWADKIRDPEAVTVTMANLVEDVASIVSSLAAGSSRNARAGAKNSEEDHAWIVDTTEKVEIVAEAVAGKKGDGADWSRVATLTVDGNGIDARVVKAEAGLITANTRIQQTEDAIRLESQRRTSADNTLSGRINVTANRVALVVEERNGQNVIKSASIVTAINQEGSSVAISADHVSITGNSKLSGSLEISGGDLIVKKTTVMQGHLTLTTAGSYVQAPQFSVTSSGKIQFIGSGAGESYSLTAAILKGMVKEFSVENGVLTLTPFYGDPVTFSRATVLSGAWGSGADADYYVVTASPQGNKHRYNPPLRLNGTTQFANFSAEITETTGSTTVAKKSVNGYLLLTADGENSYVDVNTKSDGTGTAVARISVGSIYKPETGDIGFDQLSLEGSTASTGGRTQAGSFRKALLSAPGYIFFRIGCRGTRKLYYLVVNT